MAVLEYSPSFVSLVEYSQSNVHRCKVCSCSYFTTSLFRMVNHLRAHRSSSSYFNCKNNKVEAYYCKDCHYRTELTILFKQHLREHHRRDLSNEKYAIKKYSCEKCNFETHCVIKSLQHGATCLTGNPQRLSSTGDAEKRYKPKNSYTFRRRINKHQEVYLNDKNIRWYQCKECPYKSKECTSLRTHIVTHHLDGDPIRRYKCKKCLYRTKVKTHLKTHINIRHLDEESVQWYECAQCPYKAKAKAYLRNHIISRHWDDLEVKWAKCTECPFKTKHCWYLKHHMNRCHSIDEIV